MKQFTHLILTWSISAVVVSCDTTSPSWKPLEISTDKLNYTSFDTVIVTVFNPSGYTAHVNAWSGKVIYGIYDSTWKFYATYRPDSSKRVGSPYMTIQANRSTRDSLPLSSLIFHEGLYRLSVQYWLAVGELRNPITNKSNDFTVRLNR